MNMPPTFIEELLRDAETKEANEKIEVDKTPGGSIANSDCHTRSADDRCK